MVVPIVNLPAMEEVAVVEVAKKLGASTAWVAVRPPVILIPPAKVEVAVVVEMSEPTVGEATETNLVPSN